MKQVNVGCGLLRELPVVREGAPGTETERGSENGGKFWKIYLQVDSITRISCNIEIHQK